MLTTVQQREGAAEKIIPAKVSGLECEHQRTLGERACPGYAGVDLRADAQGGSYIDGAIMVYPPTIGSEASQLLIAGDDKLVEKNRQLLDTLGGDIRYLGAEIGAAAALDMAVVSRLLAITPAVIHGALICESEGVSLQQFAEMFPEGDRARSVALTIHNNEFDENISASVDVAIGVASSIKRQAEARQINSEFPDFILGLYHRAVAAGYRHQDTSALVKILRDPTA
jgi:3-hydroxyisobutyrate dehydrogenase-like beta-hydroxyacid dehydrogenase